MLLTEMTESHIILRVILFEKCRDLLLHNTSLILCRTLSWATARTPGVEQGGCSMFGYSVSLYLHEAGGWIIDQLTGGWTGILLMDGR